MFIKVRDDGMKKLDLHIHTVKTVSDHDFNFSITSLIKYIEKCHIDGIAITNHNMFDISQFREISEALEGIATVLPGIEINLGDNSFGHMICITERDDVEDFWGRCVEIENRIPDRNSKVTYNDLIAIYPDMSKYLWIPHVDKKPHIDKNVIQKMRESILCGEVGSVKKFIYSYKDENSLIPVYFSDLRPTDELVEYPARQTYFNIDDVSVKAIKKSLLNRSSVSLTEEEGVGEFYALPNLPLSTGLNVVMGSRSSGKTHTLNKICAQNDNVKYIKQFALIETDPSKEKRRFSENVACKRSSFADEYLEPFKNAVEMVKDISLENDEREISDYIVSLVKYAKESDRADMFSRCALYNERPFPARKMENIKNLINSVENLLDARELEDIIETYIDRNSLVKLHSALIHKYKKDKEKSLKEKYVNNIVKKIKSALKCRSAATNISDVDFYKCQMNRVKVEKFNKLATLMKKEKIINSYDVGDFSVRIVRKPFESAGELKTFSGRQNVHFREIMPIYKSNSFAYLQRLKEMGNIAASDYYKYFASIECKVLNKYGFDVSGGERAEFNLLQEIDDANNYEMLLIDEIESSFDNIFLKENVNHIIKEISKKMPVVLVTHNNTVGASIKPDFIVYTQRNIKNNEVSYELYYGRPSSRFLKTFNGKEICNIKATLDCLEAGEDAYNERNRNYELLKN
jgi:hypothetical protein